VKSLLIGLSGAVRDAIEAHAASGAARRVFGDSPGGDAQFDIDEVAERVVWDYVTANAGSPLAVYTEDGSLRTTGRNPEYVLVVDPIDGTRPASAHLEMGVFSVAAAPMADGRPRLGDVTSALVTELKGGASLYADSTRPGVEAIGYPHPVPRLSPNTSLAKMFWSIEFNGHPMSLMTDAYAHLVDQSANTGGVFVFNSASFSITRIVTGQLDAYVDIGNRILRDHPGTEAAFRSVGRGNILHLFPYDIAASVLIARKSGVTITDAYGKPLDDMPPDNQRSCVAASTPQLHQQILDQIRWDDITSPESDRRNA
jgi:myo-inositol-1(or 4)-monophosphatase